MTVTAERTGTFKVHAHDTDLPGGYEVVSLVTGRDGKIYGGMTGDRHHLLCEYDPKNRTSRDVGDSIVSAPQMYTRKGEAYAQKIHHALSVLPDGRLVGGTGQNIGFGTQHRRIKDDEGGHVFIYDPKTDTSKDLGVPVQYMWIVATAINKDGSQIFGMTYFHNDFFAMDLRTGEILFNDQVHGGVWRDSACSHTIVCDDDGIVYGSCSDGYIFTYDSKKKKLTETDVKLPGGEETFRIDSAIIGDDGLIYAGTHETGIVFSIEPGSLKVEELCRPNDGPRIPALVVRDGRIYGAAGGGPQYGTRGAFLFEYDPASKQYREIGPIVDQEQGVEAYRVHAMTVGHDGTIYAGETGANKKPSQRSVGHIETGRKGYIYVMTL